MDSLLFSIHPTVTISQRKMKINLEKEKVTVGGGNRNKRKLTVSVETIIIRKNTTDKYMERKNIWRE